MLTSDRPHVNGAERLDFNHMNDASALNCPSIEIPFLLDSWILCSALSTMSIHESSLAFVYRWRLA
jgi:hypothetical protein